MTMVTLQLLAVCLCLRCKQRSLGNELRNLRTSVARIPTQRHVTLPWDHMTKNHTHESQTSCYAAGLQPSNHIREGVPESEHLGGSDYYNCKDRVKDLATPSQSSLEGSDWDSEVIAMKISNYCNYADNFCTSHNMYLQLHVLPHIPHTLITHTTHHTHHTTLATHPLTAPTLTTPHSPHTILTTHHSPYTHHTHITHVHHTAMATCSKATQEGEVQQIQDLIALSVPSVCPLCSHVSPAHDTIMSLESPSFITVHHHRLCCAQCKFFLLQCKFCNAYCVRPKQQH